MVANVVDDHQALLALGHTKPATELLEPDNGRLRRPKHHHRVYRRDIDALVEHVDGKNDLEFAAG